METSKRINYKVKTKLILEVLGGTSIEMICFREGLKVDELEKWKLTFIEHGENGLKQRAPKSTETNMSNVNELITWLNTHFEKANNEMENDCPNKKIIVPPFKRLKFKEWINSIIS